MATRPTGRPPVRRGDRSRPRGDVGRSPAIRACQRGAPLSTFADSSAIIKLYVDEPGHGEIRGLTDLAVSVLARVEVPAAFWIKQRAGEVSVESATTMSDVFRADFLGADGASPRFAVTELAPALLESAAGLVAAQGLRASDAVQLAGAIAAREASDELVEFACFDFTLRRAAARAGFALVPTEEVG